MSPKTEDECRGDIFGVCEDFRENWLDYHEDKLLDSEFFRKNCCYCSRRFPSALKCYYHERFCNEGTTKRFTCRVCSLNFGKKNYLMRHEKRHKEPGSYLCGTCDAKFTSPATRMEHRFANHRVYQCSICLTRCENAELYVTHILSAHSIGSTKEESTSTCHKMNLMEDGGFIQNIDPLIIKREHSTEDLFVSTFDTVHPLIEVHPKEEDTSLEMKIAPKDEESFPMEATTKNESDLDGSIWNEDPITDSDTELPIRKRKKKEKIFTGEKQQYQCKRCNKSYLYPHKLILHARRQHKMHSDDEDWPKEAAQETEKLFSCDECQRSFKVEFTFITHMKNFHGKVIELPKTRKAQQPKRKKQETFGEYPCVVCKKVFTTQNRLEHHKFIHDEKAFKCNYCDKSFRRKLQLLKHEADRHRKRRTYSCHRCAETFAIELCFVKHLKKEHGLEITIDRFDCKFCKRLCYDAKTLEKHIKKRHFIDGKAQFQCKFCPAPFEDLQLLKNHTMELHKDKLTCTECNKLFKNEACLQRHIKAFHKNKIFIKKTYLCGKCGKDFQARREHADHERSNCGKIFLYKCDICSKHFATPTSLRTHKNLHSDLKPHVCKYCGKAFKTKGEVVNHERGHTGEKPFKCSYCDKAYAYRESLHTHVTVHTGFKRFMCSGCGQRFTCISNLQAHRRSHAKTCGLVPNCTKTMGPMDAPISNAGGAAEEQELL